MKGPDVTSQPPRVLFTGGTVWRGAGLLEANALLVDNGRIVAFDDEAERSADANATRVDLDGGFLMASFGEGHAHPLFGGLEAVGPAVRSCTSVQQIVDEVRRYAEGHPDDEWIVGASYDGSLATDGLFDAHWLDEAVSDRPVVLRGWDYHTVWCNSRALELAGIDRDTPEPPLGEIPRRDDGSPLGTLREWGAVDLVTAVAPTYSIDVRVDAVRRATAEYARMGVTWVQDAWVEPGEIEVYLEAARRGALSTRVNLALLADPRSFPESLPAMVEARERVRELGSPLLTADTVKFFADGVIENETGALLAPYCSGMHDHGMLLWDADHLRDSVAAVDAAGFQPFIHAIGDAAVRQSLDAIEYAADLNGPSTTRPVITHAQLVDPADFERFVTLGVIANLQPLWAQLDPLMTVLTVPRLGAARAEQQYRTRTLMDLGVSVSFGSDWPCSSAVPLEGIAIAISRVNDEGLPRGGWVPEEIIDIERALAAYSQGTANQAHADRSPSGPWGRLEAGASADLVVLASDPRSTPPNELPAIEVRATYLAGSPVWSARTGAEVSAPAS